MPVATRPTFPYAWSPISQRYYSRASGKFVSSIELRTALDAALKDIDGSFRVASEQLRTRAITLDVWRLEMRQLIKETHLFSAALAEGGWAQLSPADYGRVGRLVRDEYAYLERFVAQIQEGLPLDGRFLARTDLYAQAGRQTYHAVERQAMSEHGLSEERSILAIADHCSECIEEAARGWVPIGTMIPIGQRICGRNCRCSVEYR